MKYCKFHLVLLFVGILNCVSGQDYPRHDYFRFALQWPNSYCLTSLRPCRRQVPQYFTVAGLWPQLINDTEPVNCLTTKQVTNLTFARFKVDLLKYWPDLSTYNFEDSKQLWKDQWEIHGSCASDTIPPEFYFFKAFYLRQSLNLYDILGSSDIRADGSSYAAEEIEQAIYKATRYVVDIVCKKDKLGNVYLSEIHLCVDNEAKEIIDCQDLLRNCGDEPAIFPDQKFIPKNKKPYPQPPTGPRCPGFPPS
ncbi:hypothetical protein L6164_007252 [Bauhinia variegata]|uniref:Uncharacterized protein n=1 Tax=Bauhinia variegata TaxID=167791 RepID=A0ACB9PBY9_BAUVA|nr:hypothetical protein L6164_007252 [Bauhinia variegata]